MRIALIAEHFPPLRSSCAVQMRDLALELQERGHSVVVLTPGHDLPAGGSAEDFQGVEVVRLNAFETRDRSYAVRVLGELAMPFMMLRRWRKSPAAQQRLDAVAWYSPNIFFGPLVAALKRDYRIPAYLILRDIFPEWAADVGVMRRGAAFAMLQHVARYQYRVADIIGVQTPGNLSYFANDMARGKRVEVLQNWMRDSEPAHCSIDLSAGPLAGRANFVYAGNMGVAQGMDKLLRLASEMRTDPRAGFVFVGRGRDAKRLQAEAVRQGLDNTLFHSEIAPDEIPGLYAQAAAGLVALDPRHHWHNIPGKFISYMHAGLPVLASVNPGNDMIALIDGAKVGRASIDAEGADLADLARAMLAGEIADPGTRERCRALARHIFSASAAAAQIEDALGDASASRQALR
jgi:glycosyltransferase involved in cell wall biosynthesis